MTCPMAETTLGKLELFGWIWHRATVVGSLVLGNTRRTAVNCGKTSGSAECFVVSGRDPAAGIRNPRQGQLIVRIGGKWAIWIEHPGD